MSGRSERRRKALKAGAVYFLLVFALGFVLGTLRVMVLAPLIGDSAAVLLELPIILTASWVACGWCLARWSVASGWVDRMAVGITAFALLMAAELAVSVVAFGRSLDQHLATYDSVPAVIGLAGQLVFAAFPLLHSATRWRAALART
jgi:ABC-type uncharacterized transport system permease subunit